MATLYAVPYRTEEGIKKEWEAVFPKGNIYVNSKGKAYIKYNKEFVSKFADNGYKTQAFLDKTVARYLSAYVSLKTGTQQKSIVLASDYGSGIVTIGVPYAEYQAYSKRIKKQVGLRGTKPFERMKADRKDNILKQVASYSRRLNNGR